MKGPAEEYLDGLMGHLAAKPAEVAGAIAPAMMGMAIAYSLARLSDHVGRIADELEREIDEEAAK